MTRIFALLLAVTLCLAATGCGVWENITGDNNDDYVKLKGEPGASCSLDSECRSNSCIYPGHCQ